MLGKTILYLSRKDVEQVNLGMKEIIDSLDNMFKEKGHGRVEMPPKPGIHTQPDAFIHAMPAYIPALNSSDSHVELICDLIGQETAGWNDIDSDTEQTSERAKASGAET